jgi:hypothetical protein
VGGKVCFDECQIGRVDSFRYVASTFGPNATADVFRFKACGIAYDCSSEPTPPGFQPGPAIEDCTANVKVTIPSYDGFPGLPPGPTLIDQDLPIITGIPLSVVDAGPNIKAFCADITYMVTGVETLFNPFVEPESRGWPEICYHVQTEINCSNDSTPLPLAPDNSNDPCRGCQSNTIICIATPPTVDWFNTPPEDFVDNPTDTNYILVTQKVQEIQNSYPEQPGVYQGGYLNPSGLDLV